MPRRAPIIVICGPTAAGKSALAYRIARRLSGEIISADSVQIYRGLDIGSAKPSNEERISVRHHLIDVANPATEQWDAQRWADQADAAIADVAGRGHLPIVCGGTGLYLRALLNGLNPMPPVDASVKKAVRAEMKEFGAAALHAELARVDPTLAARLDPNDSQRIGRGLEVFRSSGRPLSHWQTGISSEPHPRYPEARVAGLWPTREVLRQRIHARVMEMLEAGWISEVEELLAASVPRDRGPLTALGYRQVVAHLSGHGTLEELPRAIANAHWRYAKRQLTWFRGVAMREHALQHLEAHRIETLAQHVSSD